MEIAISALSFYCALTIIKYLELGERGASRLLEIIFYIIQFICFILPFVILISTFGWLFGFLYSLGIAVVMEILSRTLIKHMGLVFWEFIVALILGILTILAVAYIYLF